MFSRVNERYAVDRSPCGGKVVVLGSLKALPLIKKRCTGAAGLSLQPVVVGGHVYVANKGVLGGAPVIHLQASKVNPLLVGTRDCAK